MYKIIGKAHNGAKVECENRFSTELEAQIFGRSWIVGNNLAYFYVENE